MTFECYLVVLVEGCCCFNRLCEDLLCFQSQADLDIFELSQMICVAECASRCYCDIEGVVYRVLIAPFLNTVQNAKDLYGTFICSDLHNIVLLISRQKLTRLVYIRLLLRA